MKTLGEQAAEKIRREMALPGELFKLCGEPTCKMCRNGEAKIAKIIDALDRQRTPCCEGLREAAQKCAKIYAEYAPNSVSAREAINSIRAALAQSCSCQQPCGCDKLRQFLATDVAAIVGELQGMLKFMNRDSSKVDQVYRRLEQFIAQPCQQPQQTYTIRPGDICPPGHKAKQQPASVGPTGEPKCPKCGNSFQNAVPDGSPELLRCATCKHVWQPASVGSEEWTAHRSSTSQKLIEIRAGDKAVVTVVTDDDLPGMRAVCAAHNAALRRQSASDRWSKEIQRLELALAESEQRHSRLLAKQIVESYVVDKDDHMTVVHPKPHQSAPVEAWRDEAEFLELVNYFTTVLIR